MGLSRPGLSALPAIGTKYRQDILTIIQLLNISEAWQTEVTYHSLTASEERLDIV